jgi:hypothetical protein
LLNFNRIKQVKVYWIFQSLINLGVFMLFCNQHAEALIIAEKFDKEETVQLKNV